MIVPKTISARTVLSRLRAGAAIQKSKVVRIKPSVAAIRPIMPGKWKGQITRDEAGAVTVKVAVADVVASLRATEALLNEQVGCVPLPLTLQVKATLPAKLFVSVTVTVLVVVPPAEAIVPELGLNVSEKLPETIDSVAAAEALPVKLGSPE